MSYEFPPILAHGSTFEQIFPDVFLIWGTVRFMPLFSITRNMVIVREGEHLTLINSVRLHPEMEAKLEQLGNVKHLVKIGAFHGMDDPYYMHRYNPTLWALPGAKHKGDLQTQQVLEEAGPLPFLNSQLFVFNNIRLPEAALLINRNGGILLTCDSVQNWQSFAHCSLIGRLFMQTFGFAGAANIGPGWRKYCEYKHGPSVAEDFERLLQLPFCHLLSGHGDPLINTAKDNLRTTVDRIYGRNLAPQEWRATGS